VEHVRADIRFLKEEIRTGALVLVESPDPERGLLYAYWSAWYAEKIRGFNGVSPGDVFELPPQTAALGACEYVARIANGLPSYFDHIYGIEIAALNEDGESHDFIPLFPGATRVPGNQEFKRRLEGRFAVQPGSHSLSFHLWRQDDPDRVRRSKTELDSSSIDLLPIALEVTQRPVSGYATVEVIPKTDGALGARRVLLDWEQMEVDTKSRAEVVAELDRDLPTAYPNHLPTVAHPIAWEVIDVKRAMRLFLSTPVVSSSLDYAAEGLLTAIRRRVSSPQRFGVDVKQPVYLFDSNGAVPLGIPRDQHGGLTDLVSKVRTKLTNDIQALGGSRMWRSSAGMSRVMSNLFLAGCWMYAGAPSICVDYMRDVFRGSAAIGRRVETVGRVVSSDSDVQAALNWLMDRLRSRVSGGGSRLQITRELKAVSSIIQYRENSYRFLTARDARDLVRFALQNLTEQLNAVGARGRPKDLKFSFLFSATVFLLALRYRKKDRNFLNPPAKGEKIDKDYSDALRILQNALRTVRNDVRNRRRDVHRLAPGVISDAIEFLQKTGGNPDILIVIGQAEADADEDEDSDS
jgi:hypothetical protein